MEYIQSSLSIESALKSFVWCGLLEPTCTPLATSRRVPLISNRTREGLGTLEHPPALRIVAEFPYYVVLYYENSFFFLIGYCFICNLGRVCVGEGEAALRIRL